MNEKAQTSILSGMQFIGIVLAGFSAFLLAIGIMVAQTMNKWYDLQLQPVFLMMIIGVGLWYLGKTPDVIPP